METFLLRVLDSFILPKRGIVLVGQKTDISAQVGDAVELRWPDATHTTSRILDVEHFFHPPYSVPLIGLLLPYLVDTSLPPPGTEVWRVPSDVTNAASNDDTNRTYTNAL